MAGQVEASCEPLPSRDIELGTPFVCKRMEVEDGILECVGVESDTIADSTEFSDGDTVRPGGHGQLALAQILAMIRRALWKAYNLVYGHGKGAIDHHTLLEKKNPAEPYQHKHALYDLQCSN